MAIQSLPKAPTERADMADVHRSLEQLAAAVSLQTRRILELGDSIAATEDRRLLVRLLEQCARHIRRIGGAP